MEKRKVEILPYQEQWKKLFLQEKAKLEALMAPNPLNVHHIGSTSVPGLSAKPIIDILVETEDVKLFDDYLSKLEEIGYIAMGENGIKGRRYFYQLKAGSETERTIHLHAYGKGNSEIARHLIFRDYLIAREAEREQYREMKEQAAKKFPFDIEGYIEAKDPFIKEMEKKALEWENRKK